MDDLIAFLRARLEDDERIAQAAALSVADHTYAPIEAAQHADKTARWAALGFLYHKRVAVEDPGWDPKVADSVWSEVADHIARHDPAWVLADVAAKRAIIERLGNYLASEHDPESEGAWELLDDHAWATLYDLALPYADHPGYLEEWRPS